MGMITWGVWTLSPGAILTINFTANTTSSAVDGIYTNRAYANSSEFTSLEDIASVILYIIPTPPTPPTPPQPAPPEIPEFEIKKEGPAEANWGETITYTITLNNIGPDATNVVISDYLPTQAEFVDALPTYTYDASTKTVTWTYDSMTSQDSKSLWVKATLKGECGSTATNKAEVNADSLPEAMSSEVDTKIVCKVVYHQNFFSGYPDGTYRPERSVSRAEVASSLGRALGLSYLEYGLDVNKQSFPDVSPKFWAFGNIEAVTSEHLVIGYPDGTYGPDRFITRAEVAMIFFRLLNLKPENPATSTFSDLSSSHWAYTAIEAVAKSAIILGYPDGTFKPDQNITRAEYDTLACKSLYRVGSLKTKCLLTLILMYQKIIGHMII